MTLLPGPTLAILLRQFYLMRGSFSRIAPLFVWIAVDIVLWGLITRYLNQVSGAGMNFVPVLLGAVLLWDFFTRVTHGVTMTFLEDVWSRNFLNLFASPLSVGEYLLGLVLSAVGTSALGLVIMWVLATGLFGLSFAQYGLLLWPFLFVLFLFGISLGIFGCALVLRLGPAAEWFIWPIPSLISPFAGVFYPVSTLPVWMHPLARVLPPSYVFEGMRTVLRDGTAPLAPLVWGAGLALLYVAAASWTFHRVYRRALASGLLARYSAESVN